MSGSPIIQNGRIVGAVTHVLVNDPTRGYGIFIENMLEAAEWKYDRGSLPLSYFDVGKDFVNVERNVENGGQKSEKTGKMKGK